MTEPRESIQQRVIAIVADALDHPPESVHRSSSLIDDLGAESIDFLDIVFRLESEFSIRIPGEEIWAGAFGRKDVGQTEIDSGIAALRERMPDFRWDRMPAKITRRDLPRLITVNTITEYLSRRLGEAASIE